MMSTRELAIMVWPALGYELIHSNEGPLLQSFTVRFSANRRSIFQWLS